MSMGPLVTTEHPEKPPFSPFKVVIEVRSQQDLAWLQTATNGACVMGVPKRTEELLAAIYCVVRP